MQGLEYAPFSKPKLQRRSVGYNIQYRKVE